MVRAGRELRLLADAFACTAERRKVRHMAESVNLSCIEMDDFFHLCAELFYVSTGFIYLFFYFRKEWVFLFFFAASNG